VVKHIVVVGGGLGGLSAAIHLAAAGQKVTVLEQEPQVGGKTSELRQNGYRWDTGPTVITLRHVLEDLFQAAGRRMDDYLTLIPMDPLTRYCYPDGTVLDIRASLAQTVANIEALPKAVASRDGLLVTGTKAEGTLSNGSSAGYLRFLAYAAQMYRITAPIVLYRDPPTLRSILRLPLVDMLRVDVWRTMDRAIDAHVRSPYLRQLFRRYATYLGASPYQARAFLNVISHVELTAGLSYPLGGTVAIARAYRRLAEDLGVEIRTKTRVIQIEVAGGRAVGVALEGGARLPADAVVAGVDATTVYHDLLPESTASRRLRRWTERAFSCSGFVLYLGIEGEHPQLAHHNLFFTGDYRAEFDAIFRRGVPYHDPTIYVAITSKSDPEHAPPGCENWYVMTNVPPTGPGWDWGERAASYRDRVLARLADLGLDVRDAIRAEQMWTPIEIARRTGAWRGALYGHSFNPWLASFQRPHNRSRDVRDLYFAGGTTHPAGGVPMVTLSGKTAARLLLQDERG
jgi:phytoene desaturase